MRNTFFATAKVISVSSNTNSFGLRGVIFATKSGEAYEVGMNYLSIGTGMNEIKTGTILSIEVNDKLNLVSIPGIGYELPRKLPNVSDKVLKLLFN